VAATDRFEEWLKGIYMIEYWILANRGYFRYHSSMKLIERILYTGTFYMYSELTSTAISDSQKAEGASLNSKAGHVQKLSMMRENRLTSIGLGCQIVQVSR
jgi:hypothetical protein